ncbi:MAG: 3-deoxy-7-phosphoheptulonate synthase [Actinobacteria bacterium]|nr:3-deoxy-7-phosphoheptulonate synthase [Actinomycetota bacterium]
MIIVLNGMATKDDVDRITHRVKAEGLETRTLVGVEKTVIAAIGRRPPELMEQIEMMPGVESVLPISQPYKLAAKREGQTPTVVSVGNATIGAGGVVMMAGPCTVESREQLITTAEHVAAQGAQVLRGGAFKPRSSPYSFQGLGLEGLKLLNEARVLTGLPVVTEVLDPRQVEVVAQYADMLQVGTRSAQNFPLLTEVGRAGKPVLLKRGMGNTLEEWTMSAEYVMAAGNPNVVLCERGIRTFETAARFTLDLNAIPLLKHNTHLPVVVDPSQGTGKWFMVEAMALAAVAAGADGLIVEVHPTPDSALIDGGQSLSLVSFTALMQKLGPMAAALGRPVAATQPVA